MTIPNSISHKLHTNDPLPAEEVDAVRKAFAGSLGELQALDEKITRLQSQLDDLSLRKQQRSDFVEGHTKLLSPARRLAPEILQEIFYQCLPTAHNAMMSVDGAPLLLGRVCHWWRQIAYSTPRLWNSIHIVTPWSRSLDEARQHAITAWLSRSGTLPLSISMCSVGFGILQPHRDSVNDRVRPYLWLIASYVHRWRSIHFTIYHFDWTDFFKTFDASDFPLLETLHLGGDPQRMVEHNTLDITAPSRKNGVLQAPRLRILSLPDYLPRLAELSLQWKGLRGLDLSTGLSPENINKALALCPNLEVCSISVATPDHDDPVVQPHQIAEVTLPKLRTLVVKNTSARNQYTFQLFEKLSAPALYHLTYERDIFMWPQLPVRGFEPHRLSTSLSSFLRRLVHPLEELDLWISSEKSLSGILPLVPDLKRLVLRGFGIPRLLSKWGKPVSFLNDHALVLLTQNSKESIDNSFPSDDEGNSDNDGLPTSPNLCPKLEVLQCCTAVFSNRQVLEFLRARSVDHQKHNVAHLRRVDISFDPRLSRKLKDEEDMNIRNQIMTLAKETGMAVHLKYISAPKPPQARATNSYSPFNGLNSGSSFEAGGFTYFGF